MGHLRNQYLRYENWNFNYRVKKFLLYDQTQEFLSYLTLQGEQHQHLLHHPPA